MTDNTPKVPSDDELASMSREELVELGGKIDGVETIYKEPRWPVPGTKAEKRTERLVAYWLLLGGLSGLALLLVFLFWPWEYQPFGSEGEFLYTLATPLYGLTFGLGSAVFGKQARALADRIRAGMTSVNSVLAYSAITSLPFGGVGESGFGRIHGDQGIREFARTKATAEQVFSLPVNMLSFRQPRNAADRVRGMIKQLYGSGAVARAKDLLGKLR